MEKEIIMIIIWKRKGKNFRRHEIDFKVNNNTEQATARDWSELSCRRDTKTMQKKKKKKKQQLKTKKKPRKLYPLLENDKLYVLTWKCVLALTVWNFSRFILLLVFDCNIEFVSHVIYFRINYSNVGATVRDLKDVSSREDAKENKQTVKIYHFLGNDKSYELTWKCVFTLTI